MMYKNIQSERKVPLQKGAVLWPLSHVCGGHFQHLQ